MQDKPKDVRLCVSISLSIVMEIVRRTDEFAVAFGGNASASFKTLLDILSPSVHGVFSCGPA